MPTATHYAALAQKVILGSLSLERIVKVLEIEALEEYRLPWTPPEKILTEKYVPPALAITFGELSFNSSFNTILRSKPNDQGFTIQPSQAANIRTKLKKGLHLPTPIGEDYTILDNSTPTEAGSPFYVGSHLVEEGAELKSSKMFSKPNVTSNSTCTSLTGDIALVKKDRPHPITPKSQLSTPSQTSPTTSSNSDGQCPPTPVSTTPAPFNWQNLRRDTATSSVKSSAASAHHASSSMHQLVKPKTALSQTHSTLTNTYHEARAVLDSNPNYQGKLIRPRGLKNGGNMCFMNAILQPLIHCPPFYNFLKMYENIFKHSFKSTTPLIDSMLQLLNEFKEEEPNTIPLPPATKDYRPFVGEYVYDVLRKSKHIESQKGRQEDAEEFLGFLLEGLHEELLRVDNAQEKARESRSMDSHRLSNGMIAPQTTSPTRGAIVDGECTITADTWMEVGKKKKVQPTRTVQVKTTAIARIFGGQMRSAVKSFGSKDSTTSEPFQALQLDITSPTVNTIEDALRELTLPEVIEGYTSSEHPDVSSNATKQTFLEVLPAVLILHLKRFVYDSVGGTLKVSKHIAYSTELKISTDILAPSVRATQNNTKYHLFAIVNHHGKRAAGGHYTCDVLRQNESWLHIDDSDISMTTAKAVTSERRDGQPYMLFFAKS